MLSHLARDVRGLLPEQLRDLIYRGGLFFAPDSRQAETLLFPSTESTLRCLALRGFRPRLAVDVGAYHGEWTVMFKDIFPGSAVTMVEAQQGKEQRLREVCEPFRDVDYRIALLGASGGETVRFVEMETGSSVLEEQSPYPGEATTRTTTTLDELLIDAPLPVDFLKLDVQGYELAVLKGAERCLRQAQVVFTEVSLVPVNQDCPLLAEIVAFLGSSGFRVADFCSQTRWRDGVLWQTDLLFLREDSGLLPEPRISPENWYPMSAGRVRWPWRR